MVISEAAVVDKYGITLRSCPVLYTNEAHLLPRIRDTYNNDRKSETEEEIYRDLASTKLLIIDDVGKTRPRDLSYLQTVYYRIIDDRYALNKRIILTTNLIMSALEEHLGGAVTDRLREMCGKGGFIKMAGVSYRKRSE